MQMGGDTHRKGPKSDQDALQGALPGSGLPTPTSLVLRIGEAAWGADPGHLVAACMAAVGEVVLLEGLRFSVEGHGREVLVTPTSEAGREALAAYAAEAAARGLWGPYGQSVCV